MDAAELEARAAALVDAGRYLTLGTADAGGTPWVSPVWYAHVDAREFLWVSRTHRRHSRNIAVRPEVSIVVFDSHAPLYEGVAVFATARAALLEDEDAARGIEVFSARSLAQGSRPWTLADVSPPGGLRLFRATALARDLGFDDERHALPR